MNYLSEIKIGNQIWTSKNLDIEPQNENGRIQVMGINGIENFYKWEEAIKICPKGWKIPTLIDWEMLFKYLGGQEIAARELMFDKSVGFNAKVSGIIDYKGEHIHDNYATTFMTATDSNIDGSRAYIIQMITDYSQVNVDNASKQTYQCIRCIKA